MSYSPQGHKESYMTEGLNTHMYGTEMGERTKWVNVQIDISAKKIYKWSISM